MAKPYFFSKVTDLPFSAAIIAMIDVLGTNGFGVLTDINVQATLKKKLDVSFRPYRILGACNSGMAHKALLAEDKIGTMLPRNVIFQNAGGGKVEVAAIDPVASMPAIDNPALQASAGKVRAMLQSVMQEI